MITSIHKLPLSDFIDAIVDQDYSGIGEGSKEAIAAAWEDILYQYNDAIGDDNQKNYMRTLQDFQKAKSKYILAETYLECLNATYVSKWADHLNKLVGSKVVIVPAEADKYFEDPANREKYQAQLKNCNNRNKGNLLTLKLAEIELKRFADLKTTSGEAPDRAHFVKVLVNLKNHNQREIPYNISTFEFCVLVNQYSDYVKYMEANHGRRA
jgi:hypothetical protein